jgi:hypothetical protein
MDSVTCISSQLSDGRMTPLSCGLCFEHNLDPVPGVCSGSRVAGSDHGLRWERVVGLSVSLSLP